MSAAKRIAPARVDLRLGQADGAATSADEISVIATIDGSHFAKRVYAVAGGGWDADPVPKRRHFRWGKIDTASMDALHAGLVTVYDTTGAATIDGAPKAFRINADMSVTHGRRTLKLTDRKARRAMVLDCDKMPVRVADYPHPEQGAEALADSVPSPFRGADCLVVLSSTVGLPGQERWKAQIWYLLDEPVGERRKKDAIDALNAQIKAATGQEHTDERPIDPKPSEAVQPRYGRPFFEGVADPFPGDSRFIRIEGDRRRVRAADLPELDRESGRARPKGRAAAAGGVLGRKRKTKEPGALKAARSVPAYDPNSRDIPADTALFEPERDGTRTGSKYFKAARDIERLVHLRWHGRVPEGWRMDVIFRATSLAACAEGLPSGKRVREIAEEYRCRLAPEMDMTEIAAGMSSLAERAARDVELSEKEGRPLGKAEIAKYTYRLGTICYDLLISPAEQMRLVQLHTPKIADRKRKMTGTAARTVATTGTVKIPNADRPKGEKRMGLRAMKDAARAQADATEDPQTGPRWTGAGPSSMKRPAPAPSATATAPEPILSPVDPDDPFADLGVVVVEWTPPPEEPDFGDIARFLGVDWTRQDVRDLTSRATVNKQAAKTLHRAKALYQDWRQKQIAKHAA
mgnify:CR=1 FL=1